MKKTLCILILALCAFLFCFSAAAEELNLMSDYRDPLWEGDTLVYEENYGTVSFSDEGETAFVTFPVDSALGFWFYFDMGNYHGKGTGFATVEFFDENGTAVESYVTEKNSGNGSFNRYELGSSEEYAKIPENSESVRITINYEGGEQSPYFRNFSLMLSDSRAVNEELNKWDVSGKLQIVQVGVTRKDHVMWIIFVALVALIMLAVRKIIDKTKKIK